MSEQQVSVKFGAETGPLKDGANQAAQAVENTVGRMSGAFANMASQVQGHTSSVVGAATNMATGVQGAMGKVDAILGKLSGGFAVMAAAMAGGAFFKSAIEETKQFTGEAVKLSKALGITVAQASTLNIALGDIYASADTFIGASQAMTRQLKTNEQGIKDMGVQTRDASGELRPMNDIIMDSIKTLNDYREGTDRSIAAQKLFGRGSSEAMQLLKLNNEVLDEARKKQEALGLTVSQENVEAMQRYKAAMNDVGDVVLALKKVVGDALIPILTDLGEWFAESGPQRVAIMRGAVNSLLTVFYVFKTGVETVWLSIKAFVQAAAVAILSLADAWVRLQNIDMEGAKDALKRGIEQASDILDASAAEAEKRGMAAWQKINDAWEGKSTPATKKASGTKTMAEGTDDASKGKSRMSEWDVMLDRQKLAHEKINAENETFFEFGKQREADYWSAILARQDLTKDERIGAEKKHIGLLLEIRKDEFTAYIAAEKTKVEAAKFNADEQFRIESDLAQKVKQKYGERSMQYEVAMKAVIQAEERAQAARDRLSEIDIKREQQIADFKIAKTQMASDYELQMGQITSTQAIANEMRFEQEIWAAKSKAMEDRAELYKRDTIKYREMLLDNEEAQRQHDLRMEKLKEKAKLDDIKYALAWKNGMQSGFQSVLSQFFKGTMTIGNLFKGLFTSVLDSFTNMMAQMVSQWMAKQIFMLVFGEQASSAILADKSAEAGAAGVASMAGAPWPLNMTAPAFGASMAAAAAGFSGLKGSKGFAVGSWDVPDDMVAKVHKGETIMPREFAEKFREDGATGAGNVTLHINAVDGKSVRDLFMREGAALADAIQRQARNMKMTGATLRGA